MNFAKEARVTASQEWFGDLVGSGLFGAVIADSIMVLRRLDAVKKALFYGTPPHGDRIAPVRNVTNLPQELSERIGLPPEAMRDMIHGIIGVATEAGELLEALEAMMMGGDLDMVNLTEESGDVKWYLALLAGLPAPAGFNWGDDEDRCIAKLRRRFGDKFTTFDARNRDLVAERKVLEGGS